MAETTIEWTAYPGPDGTMLPGYTFNPWEGCQKVGPGCDHCYAEARDVRFTGGTHWGPHAPRRLTSAANWAKPLRWNRDAAAAGTRPRVFCASLADVFDNAVDPQWRADLWALIAATPHLDWLLLTKRPGNIAKMLPAHWGTGWPNVWLGCTVVNQEEADRDIPKLLACPAAVRFISAEPLLGPVDIDQWLHDDDCGVSRKTSRQHGEKPLCHCGERPVNEVRLDWVIVGGESGPHARAMHPQWARDLRDQCAAEGVAFLFKQWGENAWVERVDGDVSTLTPYRAGKHAAGRLLDGIEHNGFPGVKP